jgi:phosphatidylglycerol:prolipoprotein diacylglycerol transferase
MALSAPDDEGRSRGPRAYWILIILFGAGALALYLYHLATGYTPDRVAFSIGALDLDVYWYGIIITAGIALGAYVVADLANRRAVATWQAEVPAELRQQPIATLSLPEELELILGRNKVKTVGELLFWWGVEPERLGLNREGREQVTQRLLAQRAIARAWVERPPWYQWAPGHVWSGLFWCLILAVIGARLYHVLTPSPSMAEQGINSAADYFRNPLQLINLRRGGLGIYGGLAGGLLGLLLYTTRRRISMLRWADLAVVGLALGQFVGRWGNFVNQELYGRPTELPWAVTIEPQYRLDAYVEFSRFHPAFLYESVWNLFAFLLLYFLATRYRGRLMPGDLMGLYLILYGVGRILTETVRLDSDTVTIGSASLAVATLVSLLVALVMGGWLLLRRVRSR